MKARAEFLLFGLTLLLFLNIGCTAKRGKLADFNWMLGLWKTDAGETIIFEEWTQISDSVFEGNGYKYPRADEAQKSSLESVQLISRSGDVFYVPTVIGQNQGQPVYFRFTGKSNNEYTFENNEHDFPQQIIYIPVSDSKLKARVEGNRNGQIAKLEFEYFRVDD